MKTAAMRAALLALAAAGPALFAGGACRPSDGGPSLPAGPPARPHVFRALPSRPVVLQATLQMAWNAADGLLYGRVTWPGADEHLERFWRFEGGAWVLRGRPARAATAPEQVVAAPARLALAWSDPAIPASTPNFRELGCALACHDDGSAMPDHTAAGSLDAVTMRLPDTPFYAGTGLDLWTWDAHSGPLGWWLDQSLRPAPTGGGPARVPDAGGGGGTDNGLVAGHPAFVYDPATTAAGGFAVPSAALPGSPDFFFEDPADPSPLAAAPTPKSLAWDLAVAAGYTPAEGDTVPARVQSRPLGSAGDVLAVLTADGGATVRARSGYDAAAGRWQVVFTRAIATGQPDDLPFQGGREYVLTLAIHGDGTAGRDHRVSMPLKIFLEDPGKPGGGETSDLIAPGLDAAGLVPDFTDEMLYPPLVVDLFLPGVLSWEYLTDTRTAAWIFGNRHGGADGLASALNGPAFIGCRDCHVVRQDDPDLPLASGGALELRTPRRGGLFEATPISLSVDVQPVLDARCGSCHAPGGEAEAVPFSGVDPDASYAELTAPGRIAWRRPEESPLLVLPATDADGRHPATGPLAGFAGSADQRRLLAWILFDAPRN